MSPTAGSRAPDPSRRRILIVEDDYLVALQFENALTEAGYDVVDIASTAEEAVQLIPDHKPELVLMDVRLAGPRDGIQAAAEILDRIEVEADRKAWYPTARRRRRPSTTHRPRTSARWLRGAMWGPRSSRRKLQAEREHDG